MRAPLQTLLCGAITLLVFGLSPAAADPPPWAPAHGYRAKMNQSASLRGVPSLRRAPFGISLGQCNKSAIGSLMGAAAGGFAGSKIGDGNGRLVAVAAGTLAGFLVGGALGQAMDDADQQCAAQALEHGGDGEPVLWTDRERDVAYRVTPDRTYHDFNGRYCREYTAAAVVGGVDRTVYGTACRQSDGSWLLVN